MNQDALAEIYDLLVKHFLGKLKAKDISSQDLSTIRQFLKDNDITAAASRHQGLNELVDILPINVSFDDDAEEAAG